jgi:putative chitobiose transport system permease protein
VAYSLLFPALLLLVVFTFYPVIYGSYLGFTHYTAIDFAHGRSPRWNDLHNFSRVFSDSLFQTGLINSLKYLAVVPALQVASLAVAVLVNRKLPGMTFFRASFYVPVITSISLAAVMWSWIYQRSGSLNWALRLLHLLAGGQGFNWLTNTGTALWAIMLVTFWRGFGYYMVLYLAGLQSIPKEIDEAAQLDGASSWQIFWRVTVPLMKPTTLLCTLLSTLAAIRVLEEILVLTGGGPLHSTYTALMYVYHKAFQGFSFNFGEASAAGLIVAVVGVILSVLNFRLMRESSGVKG